MGASKRFSAILSLFIVFISACKAGTPPPTPLTHLTAPQGGKIVFGTVDGATTQATAMSKILDIVKNNCGEKPQIGKVFQFKGTKTVGVFFTVTNHPGGNKKVAGLVLSSASGPRQVEAALLSDDAQRFGKTVNPMLQQLFGVWHPDSQAAASGSSAGARSAPAGNGHSVSTARLHTVSASDNSASVGIPDGWKLDPNSGSGALVVHGPSGEQFGLFMTKGAIDPTHPFRARSDAQGQLEGPPGTVVIYPYRGDPTREFEGILQAWRRSNGKGPVKLQGLNVQIYKDNPNPDTNQCVTADGQVDLQDGNGMQKLGALLCVYNDRATFRQWGNYMITFFQLNYLPMTVAQKDKDSGLIPAIVNTYKQNDQVMKQQMNQKMAQKQQSDQQWRNWGQQQSDRIRAQSQAMQKSNAERQAGYDAQHASYWDQQHNNDVQHANWSNSQLNNTVQNSNLGDGQDTRARNNQNYDNYILDQTVVQDNNMYNNGTIGHGTVWNSTADALVKADPDRFEYVTQPNFWEGTDYHR
jgi:hypothetical protein